MASVIQRIVVSAFRIERNGVEPVFAVRSAIGVVLAIFAGFATGVPIYAVAAAMGAMSTGFASLQGVYRTKAGTMLAMATAMALSTVVGSLCSHSVELSILAVAMWGFAYGLVAALGPGASAIGINATIALIIFEHFPQSPLVAAGCALAMFAGGLLQTLLLVGLWPIERYPQERRALAAAYRDLAGYARASDASSRIPPAAQLAAVRKILADPRPFGREVVVEAFQSLLNEADRIRSSLALLATIGGDEYERARSTIAAALDAIAIALEDARAPQDDALQAKLSIETNDPTLAALFGQLRAAWRSATIPLTGISLPHRLPHPRVRPRLGEQIATIRSHMHFGSTFGRHGVRLAVVLTAAAVLAEVLPIQRGYWITLTAALVLRPDFTTTLSRGIARIAGTILGAVAATALVLAVPDTPHVYLALAAVFAASSYAAFQLNYGLFSLTITMYVVFLLSLLGTPESTAVQNRLIATAAGGVLAMLSYVVWPTWESPRTIATLRALVEGSLDYTRFLLGGLIDPSSRDLAKLRGLRTKLWSARAAAEESLERMLSEPEGTHEIDPDTALGIMAATQRLGVANTALSSLYQDSQTPAFPALGPLAAALADASIERADGLRDAYTTVANALATDTSDTAHALLIACDRVVDSTNTIVELWNRDR
jgi:uncharacterized membrane protein YccC